MIVVTNKYIYIDCDGVILDSEQRMLERKKIAGFPDHNDKKQFEAYFKYADKFIEEWDYIINGASSINSSVEIIAELERLKRNIVILTKVHSLVEMKMKIANLKYSRHINCPIICVPPGIQKQEMVSAKGRILIDDSYKNINAWNLVGGKGVLFSVNQNEEERGVKKVRSLEFLLKR